MFLEQLLNARGMLFWQGKAVQKPFLHSFGAWKKSMLFVMLLFCSG
jgi:hypothetical protein